MPKRTTELFPPAPEAVNELIAAAVIAKSVPPPHHLKEAAASPVLEQAVLEGKLFGYPPKTAKGKPRFWGQDVAALIGSAVQTAILQLEQPLTSKEFLKRLSVPVKLTEPEVLPSLQAAVEQGKLFLIPAATAKGQPRYWNRDLISFGQQVVLDLVRKKGPQPPAVLLKSLKGFSKEQSERVLAEALAKKELWRYPVCGKVKKELLGGAPPSPTPYLKEVLLQLESIVPALLGAGVSSHELRRSLIEVMESAGVSLLSSESSSAHGVSIKQRGTGGRPDLIAVMKRIEPRAERGALVSAAELRKGIEMAKQDFDRTVLELARQQQLTLHRHDYPGSLTPEARDELVSDGTGAYYVGMAIRVE